MVPHNTMVPLRNTTALLQPRNINRQSTNTYLEMGVIVDHPNLSGTIPLLHLLFLPLSVVLYLSNSQIHVEVLAFKENTLEHQAINHSRHPNPNKLHGMNMHKYLMAISKHHRLPHPASISMDPLTIRKSLLLMDLISQRVPVFQLCRVVQARHMVDMDLFLVAPESRKHPLSQPNLVLPLPT